MIKVTVQHNDHLVDIHFPCSETTLNSALMEIHAADDNPPELFVTDVIFPEELDHLKDRLSVLCPATKSEKNGKYYENSHPITAEAREDLNSTILEAYEQKLQEEQSEDQGEDLGQGQTM